MLRQKDVIWYKCTLALGLLAATVNGQGFKCADKQLESTIEVEGEFTGIEDFCSNLTLFWWNSSWPGNLVLEHSAYPLPASGGKELFRTADAQLVSVGGTDLVTRMNSACGRSYLVGSYQESGEVKWFDHLELDKVCSDSPDLKLVVTTATKVPNTNLEKGTENPLSALGISTINVELKGNLASRWASDVPQVVAFFLPLSFGEIEETFSEQFGYYGLNVYDVIYNFYQNNSWFMENDGLYQDVIKLGLKDGNMFYNPHFFHNSSILDFSAQLTGGKLPEITSSVVAKINLAKMILPEPIGNEGLFIVALDPNNRIPDSNRTDNVFVQFVNLNYTGDYMETETDCSAYGVGLGKKALLRLEHQWKGTDRSIITQKGSVMKGYKVEEKINKLLLNQQLADMNRNEVQQYCSSLQNMLDAANGNVVPIKDDLGKTYERFYSNLEKAKVNETMVDNKTKILELMKVMKDTWEAIENDESLSKMFHKMMMMKSNGGNMHGSSWSSGGKRPNYGSSSERPMYGGRPNYGSSSDRPMYGGRPDYDEMNVMGWQDGPGHLSTDYNGFEMAYDNEYDMDYNNTNDYQYNDWSSKKPKNWGGKNDDWYSSTEYPNYSEDEEMNGSRGKEGMGGAKGKEGMDGGKGKGQGNSNSFNGGMGGGKSKETIESGQGGFSIGGGGNDKGGMGGGNGVSGDKGKGSNGGQGGGRGQGSNGGQGGGRGQGSNGGQGGGRGQGSNGGQGGGRGQGSNGGQGGGRGQESKGGQGGGRGQGGSSGSGNGMGGGEFGGEYNSQSGFDSTLEKLSGKSFKDLYTMIESMPKFMLESTVSKHNKAIQKFLYENYNKDEVAQLEKLIAKKMKEEDKGFNFPMDKLPSLDDFDSDEDAFDALLENLDDDTFDALMDSFEASDFNDESSGGWNARRKRGAYDYKKRYSGRGDYSFKDMMGKLMSGKGMTRMPKELKDMTLFVKELIFLPEQDSQSMLGSRLSSDLKKSIREVLMRFLMEDMPMDTIKVMKWRMKKISKGMASMVKGLLPVTQDNIDELFEKEKEKFMNKTQSMNDTSDGMRNAYDMVNVIFSAIDDDVKAGITLIAQKVQGAVVMETPMPMKTGIVADPPSQEELCKGFMNFVQNPGPQTGRKKLTIPVVWREKDEGIFKLEFCPLTAKWYETKMAVCSCKKGGKRNNDYDED